MRDLRTELEHVELRDESGRIHVASPFFIDLALEIYELYKLHYQRLTGYPARIGRASVKRFYSAAVLCHEKKLSPEEFVTYQFKTMTAVGVYQPTLLDSRDSLERAQAMSHVKLDELGRYRANLELYVARAKLYGPELAIRDSTNDFSALFRAVMAHRLGLTDVVAKYYSAALDEYRATQVSKELFAGELGFFNPSDID